MQYQRSCPIPPQFCPKYPVPIQSTQLSLSEKSSGYEPNASREGSATNGVTILNQQYWKVYRYSGYFICKETISSFQHSHQVFYFLKSQLSTNRNNIQQAYGIQMKPEQSTSPYIHHLQLHSPRLYYSISIRSIYNPIFVTRYVSIKWPFQHNQNPTCQFWCKFR